MAKSVDYTALSLEELESLEADVSARIQELDDFIMNSRAEMKDLSRQADPIRLEIEYRKLAKAIKDPRTQGVGFGG